MSNLSILNFKHIDKGFLVGFFDIEIKNIGMTIRDISMWKKQDQIWFNFPSQEFVSEDGQKKYNPYIKFADKKQFQSFQDGMRREALDYLKLKGIQYD